VVAEFAEMQHGTWGWSADQKTSQRGRKKTRRSGNITPQSVGTPSWTNNMLVYISRTKKPGVSKVIPTDNHKREKVGGEVDRLKRREREKKEAQSKKKIEISNCSALQKGTCTTRKTIGRQSHGRRGAPRKLFGANFFETRGQTRLWHRD